jgi:hypothetical protein
VIRSKTWLQAIDFCFFTKTTSFWFFLKKIDPGDSVNRSKPGTRALDQTGSKNYDIYIHIWWQWGLLGQASKKLIHFTLQWSKLTSKQCIFPQNKLSLIISNV